MTELVRLRTRPSRDGKIFVYLLDYKDESSKRKRISLGHADKRKAEKQRLQKERELRMGIIAPESMRLSDFLEDCLERTGKQVRESTLYQMKNAMNSLIAVVGNIDYRQVKHEHAERFIQHWLDGGNTPATVAKKLRHLKRMFNLAVYRSQLESNPIKYVGHPRSPQRKVRIFDENQCNELVNAAEEYFQSRISHEKSYTIAWPLLIQVALCTAMRRGELLNSTWQDIDFERKTIDVAPKKNTIETWEWHIKDTDRRTLPLTEQLIDLLAGFQATQPERYPYVFIPSRRYDYIQSLRKVHKWTVQDGCNPLNNFDRQFKIILDKAEINNAEFHDFRRTCITNWFANGLSEYEVMHMAGHASFETTRKFYLAIRDDLLDKTRHASVKAMQHFGTHLARATSSNSKVDSEEL